MAADRILDRAYGKPPQLNTTDVVRFRRAADLSNDAPAAIIAGVQPASSAPVKPEAEQPPLDPKKVN